MLTNIHGTLVKVVKKTDFNLKTTFFTLLKN